VLRLPRRQLDPFTDFSRALAPRLTERLLGPGAKAPAEWKSAIGADPGKPEVEAGPAGLEQDFQHTLWLYLMVRDTESDPRARQLFGERFRLLDGLLSGTRHAQRLAALLSPDTPRVANSP
jgi:hypothetical protein